MSEALRGAPRPSSDGRARPDALTSSRAVVGAIDDFATDFGIPKAFIGLILLPIVGNAAEHVTSVWMAGASLPSSPPSRSSSRLTLPSPRPQPSEQLVYIAMLVLKEERLAD